MGPHPLRPDGDLLRPRLAGRHRGTIEITPEMAATDAQSDDAVEVLVARTHRAGYSVTT